MLLFSHSRSIYRYRLMQALSNSETDLLWVYLFNINILPWNFNVYVSIQYIWAFCLVQLAVGKEYVQLVLNNDVLRRQNLILIETNMIRGWDASHRAFKQCNFMHSNFIQHTACLCTFPCTCFWASVQDCADQSQTSIIYILFLYIYIYILLCCC